MYGNENFIGLEFIDESFEQLFQKIRFWGVPICILLTLSGTIQPNETRKVKVLKFFTTLLITAFAFFIMMILIFTGMCNWSNSEVLYTNKDNKEVKIIRRDYGCGATDSGAPIVKICIVKEFTKYFNSISEIDIEEIDQTKWIKTIK